MHRFVVLVLLALTPALLSPPPGDAGKRAAMIVPSLEPLATQRLWSRLTARPERATQASAQCRPLRAAFYAATDWLRLATKLAAARSACAEYYISVPPIVGDKTQMRPNQASRIRALGSNFHAMAEIHYTTWNRWVTSTGSTWHRAGVTARERMAAAGFDVAQGDTWVVNEVNSAVRRGDGNARANVRELLRGLYEGDGTTPTRGGVFVIGVGQRTSDLTLYQNTLQDWLSDSAFWTDVTRYVANWSQEVYGDVRSYAIPGAPLATRREYLNDYLQHPFVLASAGPETAEPARAFFREAFSPLANAAWAYDSAYGWTMVPLEQMAAYVSAQVYALRHFSATAGRARDHWGFAWAPRNNTGMSATDFASQTSALLDRLAAAIRDSGETFDPADPGSGACGPPGENTWCGGDVVDGRPSEAWKAFRTWTQSVLNVGVPAEAITAGAPTGPITLSLATSSGLPAPRGTPLTVTLRSSSPRGRFSASPSGPWTPTLTLTIAAGASAASFYYQDTRAGTADLTASATGTTTSRRTLTIVPAAATAVTVVPAAGSVRAQGTRSFNAAATDPYGNRVSASLTWKVTPAALGRISARANGSATFTARRLLRSGVVEVTASTTGGSATGSARVTVTPATLRIGSVGFRRSRASVQIAVTARDGARRPVSRALVSILVRRADRPYFTGRAATGASGNARYRVGTRVGGCFTVRITKVRAAGFRWDGRTPRNRFCT